MGASSMGVISTVKILSGGWQAPTVYHGKGVHCEVKSEGSRRQKHDLRYTNPM
ncbi:hypothetical protein GCM10008013_41400 [Paenibacillus segetis]|uniref:Uncharacterized protein n=1 Tax=Paenibacillus segetis TaxID=1325360 RepID=A0ABQ1YSB8_9BACL|nr:hypothetical protein GCM10008013_41400 [Paenibacillus segetis]